jgi:dTDP-glucose 4,6-dehydratase
VRLLVTGGCGFIGSAVVRLAIRRGIEVVNVDALTYAANPANVAEAEASPYRPNSPYAASKAAADLLARAWGATYGLNVVTTNCSNNYGPFQHPEKLIPTVVLSALEGRPIPIYGGGANVRDWLFVEDHAEALLLVLEKGRAGETYAIGAQAEAANLDLAHRLCGVLDTIAPRKDGGAYAEQISFVDDRPGHDFRYALDASKIRADLGWTPRVGLDEGLEQTVRWMLDNPGWIAAARAGGFDGGRLGLSR